MGSPVSSLVSNIFMMNFEKRALRLAVHFERRLWKRYVDDVFSITKKINTERLLTHINDIDANIRFTMERDHESLLPFLDGSVKRGRWPGKDKCLSKANLHGPGFEF